MIETKRLYLRELQPSDREALSKILQDELTMYAYEGAFSDTEVQAWLDKQLKSYQRNGFGLWAAVLKGTGEMIGQCGLTWQELAGEQVLEIGYLFQRAFWHKGYASEAAMACKNYAFEMLQADEFFSIIRDTNVPSQRVAERNGMTRCGKFIKHYRGIDMPHYVYSVQK
ncbi:GNAT family N-acetyltransferase [Enterococcus raffinosus]|uniref:GNAT family N-acetyltransferase n=1 Tax=Enterococcus raffinosus TaxID=71452 RepID=A0AAW8T3E0_9ENTE|nr:GNAT family N-acetyltransferase [Enterococcus raffinosus]MDT2521910.1 GNAT family N-acetyltransferase [Enterococcus raffinosus]MDT2528255.1 GNAT family N-acetyltransferase [Enterococcus raffinosus]MDT2533280.1 GNAT family N-acetyltransferase [Enterococcus raffinosus]MDT2543721.1 GNAT family N-acetyltransferase [Enterococcus raffinosus]MDT2553834.1 GNAT family N-acetyltransferase [Enterococcus raffinosus]